MTMMLVKKEKKKVSFLTLENSGETRVLDDSCGDAPVIVNAGNIKQLVRVPQ
jgi:hypothetical protein